MADVRHMPASEALHAADMPRPEIAKADLIFRAERVGHRRLSLPRRWNVLLREFGLQEHHPIVALSTPNHQELVCRSAIDIARTPNQGTAFIAECKGTPNSRPALCQPLRSPATVRDEDQTIVEIATAPSLST